jgi:acetyltransferase-like isoleucine patch superfamily enzyme
MGNNNSRVRKILSNPSFIIFVIEKITEHFLKVLWTAFFRLKSLLLGVKIKGRLDVFGNCIIRKYPGSKIELGDRIQLISSSWRSSTANCYRCKLRTFSSTAEIVFCEGSGATGGVIVARSKKITIGRNVMLAPNVVITDSDWHNVWPPDQRKHLLSHHLDADVTLEDNVWVGMNVIILKGVTIGENSVIAAGSIVTKSIPPNCLAGGNPAKVLKTYGAGGN